MGLFAFSGGPVAPVEATYNAPGAEANNPALALAGTAEMERPIDGDILTVKLTSYNAVPEQTDHTPTVTASGAYTNPEVIAARSVDLKEELPFGTIVEITREATDTENCRFQKVEHLIGYRVIADSMHSRKRSQIDVLLDQNDTVEVHGEEINPSIALGLCAGVTIRVIGHIEVKDIPDSQLALNALVKGSFLALR